MYENLGVLPRAFTMRIGCETITDDPLTALRQKDPRTTIILDAPGGRQSTGNADSRPLGASPCALTPADVIDYQINDVVITTQVDQPSWLVLNDTDFTGWMAFKVNADQSETEVPITRAYGNFRAVPIEAGESTIHFKYSPMSFKLGLFISFMAWMIVVFLLAIWLWRLAYCCPAARCPCRARTPRSARS